jgi:hypothetical protein
MTTDEQAIFDGIVKQRDVLRLENRELYLRAQELESQLQAQVHLPPNIVLERDLAVQDRDAAWRALTAILNEARQPTSVDFEYDLTPTAEERLINVVGLASKALPQ